MIEEAEGLYFLCSENKGADQLHGYCAAQLISAFVSAYAKCSFSCDKALLRNMSRHSFSIPQVSNIKRKPVCIVPKLDEQ